MCLHLLFVYLICLHFYNIIFNAYLFIFQGENLDQGWLTEEIVRHTLNNTEKKLKKKPSITKKAPSVLPAIEAPHPGISYNPTYHDHQDLLSGVLKLEQKYEKDEKHLNRVTSKMFKKVNPI